MVPDIKIHALESPAVRYADLKYLNNWEQKNCIHKFYILCVMDYLKISCTFKVDKITKTLQKLCFNTTAPKTLIDCQRKTYREFKAIDCSIQSGFRLLLRALTARLAKRTVITIFRVNSIVLCSFWLFILSKHLLLLRIPPVFFLKKESNYKKTHWIYLRPCTQSIKAILPLMCSSYFVHLLHPFQPTL